MSRGEGGSVMRSDSEVPYGFIQSDPPASLSDECGRLTHVFNELPLMFGEVRPWSVIHHSCGLILHVHGVSSSSEVEAARLLGRGVGAKAERAVRA